MSVRAIDANALIEKIRFREGPVMGQRDIFLIEGEPTLTLNNLRDEVYADAVAHGLWEDTDKLCKELADEGDEQQRKDDELYHRRVSATKAVFYESDELLTAAEENNWDATQEELADVVIMAMSVAGYLGIDIDEAVRRKMEINKNRPWKHGKE